MRSVQHKSKKRIRDHGEVFTHEREVKNILSLTQATSNIFWRFLEPACGNGNFIVEIIRQRLDHIKHNPNYRPADKREFAIIHMVSSIYGIDIAEDNIAECKNRIMDEILNYIPKEPSAAFLILLRNVLDSNIQIGDMLNGKEDIFFIEYGFHNSEYLSRCKIKRKVYALTDLENGKDNIIEDHPFVKPAELKPINFSKHLLHKVIFNSISSEQVKLFNTESQNA